MKQSLSTYSLSALTLIVAGSLLAHVPSVLGAWEPISGEFTESDGWLNATTKTVVEIPVASDNLITVRGKTGKEKGAIVLSFLGGDEKPTLNAEGKPMAPWTMFAADLKLHGSETVYPDAYIQMPSNGRYFVRPNLRFYKKERLAELAESWDKLPAASTHEFRIEFRPGPNGTLQIWFDGNFMQEFSPAEISLLRVTLAPGASLQELSAAKSPSQENLALPVSSHPRSEGMENAHLKLDPKADLPAGLLSVARGSGENIAVGGLSIFQNMATDDLQSFYFRRTAVDNLPEQRMFTVPQATYAYANILVAVESNPDKVDSFTLRVTRYGVSRGNAMADTVVHVPGPKANNSPDARRVGTVQYGPETARKEAPLWLLRVPIKNGLIQDILHNDAKKNDIMPTFKYLDVELMDPMYNVEKADSFPPPQDAVQRGYSPADPTYVGYDYYTARPAPQTSGVHVFGISLEPSPAEMEVRSNIGIQAFYASDQPQFEAKIKAEKAGEYTVTWDYADVDGKIIKSDQKTIKLEAGGEGTISAPVAAGNGWYSARFRLTDAKKEDLIDYRTSFVILPPDTRKAGLESPFYGWWFQNHGTNAKLEEIGPLFQRLGIRRVGLPEDMPESLTLPKYGFTDSTVRFAYTGGGKALSLFRDGKLTLAEAVAMHEEDLRHHLELWPSIDRMLVFHESGAKGAPFPSELWGEPALNRENIKDENSPEALLRKGGVVTPAEEAAQTQYEKDWPKRMEYLHAMAKMVREKFPQLKMQYGNDGNSMGILGELFRQKFPRKYIDTIASEDLGQTMAPERDVLGSTQDGWYVRELARKTGYGDVPITATTEWIGRMTEKLGLQKQAEWKARDGIITLAYGYDTISLVGINDAGDAYYYSIWANGGVMGRYPIMAPKPSYAAVATLTQVLDQAKFQRFLPTGSTVCYLAEFQRGDQWVYALWTPRGHRELTVTFKDDAKRPLTDLYGRETSVEGKEPKLNASPAVQYLVSKTPALGASTGGSSFPEDLGNVPEKPLETIPLESLEVINIVPDPMRETATAQRGLGKEIQGNFEIREVEDPEMGRCLEIELKPGRELRLGEVEYVNLKLATPITTTAKNAGIWIKGNGSWGSVDIQKNHWGPWADNGNLHMNWPGDATMNFDGWNFIMYPYYDWAHKEASYQTTVVTGLRITFPRNTLVGTERVPVENQKVRLKSILFF